MKNLIKCITILMAVAFFTASSFAKENSKSEELSTIEKEAAKDLQKIVDEFGGYAAGIRLEIKEEIKKYRTEIAQINKQKRTLYTKLSQEAQNYLAKEQGYKKRMSLIKNKSLIEKDDNIDTKKDESKIDTKK